LELKDIRSLNDAWTRFVDEIEPLRTDLFRYAMSLTRNPFDAEDLVAESMLRIFSSLAFASNEIENLKAYAVRTISRMWIDQQRRPKTEPIEGREPATSDDFPDAAIDLLDAADQLYSELAPLQRAIIVLREVLDFSHKEIAATLSISESSARVTLHRAKKQLLAPKRRAPRASRETVERFVKIFQTYDVEQIKTMLVEDVEADVFPSGVSVGAKKAVEEGWLAGQFYLHIPSREALGQAYQPELRVVEVLGDIVVLVFRGQGDGPGRALEEVWLIEEDDGRISRVRDYGFSPDLITWIADHVGEPARCVGYRLKPLTYDHLS
jgi:RNA polymerase sigma-70 factor (ECF subfamily)